MKKYLLLSSLLAATPALCSETTLGGSLEWQSQWFTGHAAWPGQRNGINNSLAVQGEFRWQSDDGNQQAAFLPYVRKDQWDDNRDLYDIREGYLRYIGDSWNTTVGINKVFWGVAESRHLVDIINQTDNPADIDGEDKLGQPMWAIGTDRDWGSVQFFWLPYFREREFPSESGRLRPAIPINDSKASYESAAEQWHQDFALRYSHYLGDWDIGLSLFHGTSREPLLIPVDQGQELRPFYQQISQLGLDLQYTYEAWLWKLESMARSGQGKTFAALVGGFEYSFYQVFESDSDLGVLMEYQYDGRNEEAPFTIADNDLFMGLRLAMNDIDDSSVLAGFSQDLETGERFFNVEAERRFGNNLLVELRARFFRNSDISSPAFSFASDSYIQASVKYSL